MVNKIPDISEFETGKLSAVTSPTSTNIPDISEFEEKQQTVVQSQPQVQPQDVETPEQDMDDLDTDNKWLKNASIIYKAEEGEDWKGSKKSLAQWFKNRHSKLNFNVTNMGLTAYDTKDMSDETKQAWIESITQYDNADWDLYSFGRGLKHATVTDPVFWASLVGGVGFGGIAKALGGRAASQAGKMVFKDQLQKALAKEVVGGKAIGEAAAKEAIETGATREVSKELLEQTAKSVAKSKGRRAAALTGAGGAAYEGLSNLSDQSLDIGLDFNIETYNEAIDEGKTADQAREEARKDSIDFGELGFSALIGGVLGGGLGKVTSNFADKRATKKILQQMDAQTAKEVTPKVSRTVSEITDTTSSNDITNEANRVQRELELNGTVEITTPKNFNKEQQKLLEDNFEAANIRVTKVGRGKFVGEKIAETAETTVSNVTGKRTLGQKIIAKVKKYVYDDGGLGDAAKKLTIRKKSSIEAAKRNILTRQKRLEKAIKGAYDSKLNVLPKAKYSLMNAALRGSEEAIDQLSKEAPKVLDEIRGMRANIQNLQKDLLDSGAIEKGSDLETKIMNSMDGKDGTELYLTRQFEVFDNPDFGKMLNETPQGQEVIRKAKEHLAIQNAVTDKKFAQAKKLKDRGATLTDEQATVYNNYMGKDGIIDNTIKEILIVNDEEDLFKVFQDKNLFQKQKSGKILTARKDIPDDIRALMGEYDDPFTNYSNTVGKLFHTAETFKYEKAIADLIEAGEIKGAQRGIGLEGEVTRRLESTLPTARGVERPLESGRVKPLEGFFGTNEVADFIANGNELSVNWVKPFQKYLMLQGHTRAAKTVYSPTAIARNFLGAAWMALGAGYVNPKQIGQVYRIFKSLATRSDEALNAEMEKGIALGYLQSGTELGALKGALRDAGEKEFWDLSSDIYKGGRSLANKAKRANVSATKFYQSMDDAWKQFAFMNEKGNMRQILKDRGENPDEIVRRFMSGDGQEITITRLDEAASEAVNNHMQNYANVPKFIKSIRILPAADFLAFKSEIIRTQKNILKSAITDIKEGRARMAEGAVDPDTGVLKGKAQRNLGYKRLGSMIAAQSAGPAVALGSAEYLGLNETEPGETNTIKEGIEAFDPEYNKGANYFYLGDPKKGKGFRINASYINPWATTQSPIVAAITGLTRTGDYVEGAVDKAFQDAVINPIREAFSPSMLAESLISFARNQDEYGRPIFDRDRYTQGQNIANTMATLFSPFEPGVIKSARDIITAYNLEGQEFGVTPKGRKLFANDQWMGLTGIKPEQYDVGLGLSFKVSDLKKRMGDTDKIFQDSYRQRSPVTVDELVDSYEQSMNRQYALATEMFDFISKAKSSGLNNIDIYKAITDGGLFKSRADKTVLRNMINKGRFIPKPPAYKDIYKWGLSTKRMTGQQPPIKEAQKEILNTYRSFVGSTTGRR